MGSFLMVLCLALATVQSAEMQPPAVIRANGQKLDVTKLSYTHPVIVVRYLGYRCEHCVRQILLLNRNAAKVKALGGLVVGISNDLPAKNAVAETELGLDTSVVRLTTDPDGLFAQSIGASIEERDSTVTELHVTLVLKKGKVVFEKFGTSPYMDVDRMIEALGN